MRILLSGAIGDVLVLESFWSPEFKAELKEIIWTSRPTTKTILPLFQQLYPQVKHTILPTDKVVFYKEDVLDDPEVEDWSIAARFPILRMARAPFYGSSFLQQEVARVPPIHEPFAVIQADTHFHRTANHDRFLTSEDWKAVLHWLESKNLAGVILDAVKGNPPDHPRLYNLAGMTTLAQAIEILKQAEAYAGIDSWMSCLACQRFGPADLLIKANNPHYLFWRLIYCAPHMEFRFTHHNL